MVNKYYKKTKKSFKKKHAKDIKIFLKKKKKQKSVTIIVTEKIIFLKKKNIRKLSICETII